MKLACQTESLHTAFQAVGSIIQQRPTRPILADVLLVAEQELELQATDLEIGIRYKVSEAEVREAGRAAVPHARLASLLGATADETVELALEEAHCVLRSSDGVFHLPTSPVEDFPALPEFGQEGAYEIERAKLEEMITRTSFAAHKGRHRYALNGALLVMKAERVRMVATDGRRLAFVEKKVQNPEGTDLEAIIPTKALEQLVKVLCDEDETILLSLSENQVVAKTARAAVSSRLVEGHFPPYESVIPKDQDKKVELERERLLSAVRRAALVTSEEGASVTLNFAPGSLKVTSSAPETGQAEITMAANYGGPELEISFAPGFLTDFLRAVEDETVRAEFRDPTTAGLFRAGKDFIYVVMPVSRE